MRVVSPKKAICKPGENHGRWVVLGESFYLPPHEQYFIAACACGTIRAVHARNAMNGKSVSCGCHKSEVARVRIRKTGRENPSYRHGGSKSRIYAIWRGMKVRCSEKCPKDVWHLYHGRGIVVCDEWMDFTSFRDWSFQNGYKSDLSIDRIDGNKGYCPTNCRWATSVQQSQNTSNNVRIYINGLSMCLQQAIDAYGVQITATGLKYRLDQGWPHDAALFTPPNRNGNRNKYKRKNSDC